METEIWVNIGSGNGLLPDGTKTLTELKKKKKDGTPHKQAW